ncbi:hypothetical protein [Mycoplasma procyoni]|uniref:hypothetical protein n=1 Tax=Mycoplasma procyoni TaxID=568784 RepID=UPI00197C59AA|nr:hypothetical protein [Mycoplasma procyoni]MBN3534899.1 hypothetical protein [Mycoplasma procyoni]
MKHWKKLAGLSVLATPMLGFISCAKQENEFKNSKEIVLSIEGIQKEFFNKVEEAFSKTEYAKKGFKLRTVEKGVFDSIDFATTTGFTDRNAADLLYSPADRINNLLANNTIMPYPEGLKDELLTMLNASDAEKKQVETFGSFKFAGKGEVNNFYTFMHNKEGIVMMSSQSLDEVKAELAKAESDSMIELVKEGKAFFRIQDAWYGNGVLASALNEEEMGKLLYRNKDTNTWSSGFLSSDPNYANFKKALGFAAELMYPVWQAAYDMDATEFAKTGWHTNGIKQDDLRTLLSSDMNAVQNKVTQLLSEKKLKYGMVGTWDIQNSIKQGIPTFLNFPKVHDEEGDKKYQFKQAPGTWSWAINARNRGVSEDRLKAIEAVLKAIFSVEAYYGYFTQDSKVSFFQDMQTKVKDKQQEANKSANDAFTKVAKELGYENIDETVKAYEELLSKTNTALNKSFMGDSWSIMQNGQKDPLAEDNKKEHKLPEATEFFGITEELKTELQTKLAKTTGLRNAVATFLGLTDLTTLKGDNAEWQVGSDLIKAGVEWPADLIQDKDKKTAHVRKIEKLVFGVNGDDEGERNALYAELSTPEKVAAKKAEALAKAKSFSETYSKNKVEDAKIKEAVDLYVDNYANEAVWIRFKDKYNKVLEAAKFNKKDGKASTYSVSDIKAKVEEYRKGNASEIILDVLTSTKSLADGGRNVLETQANRLDRNNPQFTSFWPEWNDLTFGNQAKYSEAAFINAVSSLETFKAEMEKQIQARLQHTVNTLNSSSAPDYIKRK